MQKLIFVLLLTGISVTSAFAQKTVADKIVAHIGNNVVLRSEIMEQFEGAKRENPEVSDTLICNYLQEQIVQYMMVEQADRDSIIVTPEEIEANLDNRIRYYIQEYKSKEALEAASGRTVYQLKEDFRPFFKNQLTAMRMQEQLLGNVKITPQEVIQFFNEIPSDSLPLIPATVEFGQIVIKPDADPESESYAKQRLEEIRKQVIEEGKDFGILAGLYSQDGSKDFGGELDINKTDFDPVFVSASFRLQPGEISPVIKSSFGYHIIQMIRRSGDEARVRHIIIIPEITTFDLNKALKKLDSVRSDLVSGKIEFSAAVAKYSTDPQAKRTAGMILNPNNHSTQLDIDNLKDADLARAVGTMNVGEFSEPAIFTENPVTRTRSTRILYLKSRRDPHKLNLKDDYSVIQQTALNNKKMKTLWAWIDSKTQDYYIKIAPEFAQCESLKKWQKVASTN